MNDTHLYRAKIPPVAALTDRPLWSVMIPTYNCADYLRETLTSVLAQDPGGDVMQIEVVDDCSTQDDPKSVVEELGKGRVSFYQQPKNVGYNQNFATCLQRSRGHLIHLLHGDDCVLDGFYSKMQRLFEHCPEIGAGFCRQVLIDDDGNWKYFSIIEQPERGLLSCWLERIATELTLQPPSMVVRREVYEKLGGFDSRMLSCGEDWEMWCRIAAQYPVGYEPEVLAVYRDRSNSLTKLSIRTGQNIRDVFQANDIVKLYLPKTSTEEIHQKARENWALWAVFIADQSISKGSIDTAIGQIRAALKGCYSVKLFSRIIPLVIRVGKYWLHKNIRLTSF